MKMLRVVLVSLLVVLLGAGIVLAMKHEASVDKGKALFNDQKLGTAGKSCNDCHPNGKGLEKSGGKSDLDDTINMCITRALKGKALDAKSTDMQSMILYMKSLKKAPIGC